MSPQTAEAKSNSTSKHVNVPGKPEGWVAAGDLQEVITLEEMLCRMLFCINITIFFLIFLDRKIYYFKRSERSVGNCVRV